MIGLALSGGGSRAIAFHLGCLRALNDLELLDRISVLSTISGGSVIGAYYAYTPQKAFDEFESDMRNCLRRGFQRSILRELIKPQHLLPIIANSVATKMDECLSRFKRKQPSIQRYPSRTDVFHKVLQKEMLHGLSLNSPRRNEIEIVIGACELRTGTAFRFGNEKSGFWRGGVLVNNQIDVAFAVAASAAYPLLLPALDRTWSFSKNEEERNQRVILTDGGVYDNLGIQVLEPGRDPKISLHTFPCEYLIICNAGHGLLSGENIPQGLYSRVKQSFGVIHRRAQDASMHRLHHLKEVGLIKAFVLSYLGQQDKALPWKPSGLIPREEVNTYPTDFAAMSKKWIDKLSNRGEQLTRLLVSCYFQDILA